MAAASPIERITSLLALLLERRTPLTLRQIADELSGMYPANQVARRGAFERDKALLRDVGVPIETEVLGGDQAGETAYRIDRARYELSGLQLDDDERRALQVAVATTRSDAGQEAVWKLGGSVVQASSVVAHVPQLDALPTLRQAIGGHHTVTFEYHGAPRRLDPYGLLLRRGFWYVIGHDHGHGEQRTYRVDRIDGEVAVDASSTFTPPTGFSAADAFPADPKLLGVDDSRVAHVAVYGELAALVARELGETAVDTTVAADPDRTVFSVSYANIDAFRSWLLGLGVHAEVLGPADLRVAIVEWLRAVAGSAA
ncbi:MAG: WYL domain-containing transcriptional regulator [Actinobacteria bacterium]|nr:WYL domain-containing transcriptional regulator [Actinomycetota bacterium]